MDASFVKPVLGQVLRRRSDGECYRVICQGEDYALAYQLPHRDELLELVGISGADYDAQCARYERWLQGDATVTPLHLTEFKPVRYDCASDEELLARTKQVHSEPWMKLFRWSLKFHRIYKQRPPFKMLWEVEGVICHCYDWGLIRDLNENKAIEASLEWGELEPVPDPAVPLLHTPYNDWEKNKINALKELIEPLDLGRVVHEVIASHSAFQNNLANALQLPSYFPEHMLHVWCIFGGIKESLIYVQEILDDGWHLNDLTSLDLAQSQSLSHHLESWQRFFWSSFYNTLHECVDVFHEVIVPPHEWQTRLESFAAPLVTAFGGPGYSLLHALKYSVLLGPTFEGFKDSHGSFIHHCEGQKLKSHELCDYGIDPHYFDVSTPLPFKEQAQQEAVEAKLREQLDLAYMGYALEQAVLALQEGVAPIGAYLMREKEGQISFRTSAHKSKNCKESAVMQAVHELRRHSDSDLEPLHLTIYLTQEPDRDDLHALIAARVERIVYAAPNLTDGVFSAGGDFSAYASYAVKVEVGLRAEESAQLFERYLKIKDGD